MKTKLSILCEKIIEAGWLAAVVTVPLFFNIYSARTFEPDKITLLRSIVSIMVLAWIVLMVEQGRNETDSTSLSLANRFHRWLNIPLFLPTALLVLIYIISTIFSIAPSVSLWGSYQRMQGTYSMLSYIVVFALMASQLRTREQVDRLVTVLIITSIPVSLYGIVQRYGLDPLPWAGDVTQRVASNMGNAIFVASYLIMVIPLTLSRLIESMTAIIKEEDASWGHTILAAVYIFALAVQFITVIFSQSRGPMLGVLGAGFVMGLVIMLLLRRLHDDSSALSVQELGAGIAFLVPLGLITALGGGIGYFLGLGLQNSLQALNYPVEGMALLGAAMGGLLGFFGLYTYMTTADRGWRWLWLSWVGIGILAIGFVLLLNLRGTGLDLYLDPIRELPYANRLSRVIETERTGRVRVLIWDAAMELVAPHEPLGISGDEVAREDNFNIIRPLIGYGPESMFNAFALVYPPELAHVENRGSSADRSHNETMDSLVITGVLGFLAFYFLMVSLFYYALNWLDLTPDNSAKRRLLILLILSGAAGAVIAYIADGGLTFTPLGLPFGLMTGIVIYLIWQGVIQQDDDGQPEFSSYHLLLVGLLGAIIGHFIEVHFVFSIAATYTYFWAYAGLIVALSRMKQIEETAPQAAIASSEAAPEEVAVDRAGENQSRKRRRVRRAARKKAAKPANAGSAQVGEGYIYSESLDTWVGGHALAMAIILITLAFDFITPQFQVNFANIWMFMITWIVGFSIVLAELAVQRDNWRGGVNWVQAIALYSIISLSYFIFYASAHSIHFQPRIAVNTLEDVITAANILANGLVLFYVFLFLLMLLFAITLAWRQMRHLSFWRAENWWLYPPLVIAIVAVIWFKNINVVRADVYLKEGERYRGARQWDQAIALHEKARFLDRDEDFYYLMLALDYQLMAQDQSLDPAQRQFAWQQGERIALEARAVNPYNPDNTGNMGRYYFTLGQIFDPSRFSEALRYFEKATTLAPSNVIYHNLWAQTHYILQDYQKAIDRLQTSIAIDPQYPPTWILLGDTYAAIGEVEKALEAHSEAIKLKVRGSDGFRVFADQAVRDRLNFYISAGRAEDIIAAMQQVAIDRPEEPLIQWAIGYAYSLQDQQEKAIPYFEQALALGDNSDRTVRSLANAYLSMQSFEQAQPLYELLIQNNPNDIETHSALAFIYAQQGRVDEAIQHNQAVLQHSPNDYDSLKNLAILYQRKGDWQQALSTAQQAQSLAPEAERPSWQQFISEIESELATAG